MVTECLKLQVKVEGDSRRTEVQGQVSVGRALGVGTRRTT